MTARPPATPDETGATPPVQPPPDRPDDLAQPTTAWALAQIVAEDLPGVDAETCLDVVEALLTSTDPAVARALLDHYWQTTPDTVLAAGTDAGVLHRESSGAMEYRNGEAQWVPSRRFRTEWREVQEAPDP